VRQHDDHEHVQSGPVVVSMLLIAPPGAAKAAASVTVPGSCRLSANWLLTMSATWYNTSGSPSRGNFRYAVIRSPGALALGAWTIISPHNVSGGLPGDYRFRSAGRDGSDYLYRADANLANISYVYIRGQAPSGIYCEDYVYSRN
jgi:hypothetical protein